MQQNTSTSLRKVLAKHHGISAVRSTGACLQVLKQLSGAKALRATAKSQVHCADASAVAKFQEGMEKGRTQKRLLPFEIVRSSAFSQSNSTRKNLTNRCRPSQRRGVMSQSSPAVTLLCSMGFLLLVDC